MNSGCNTKNAEHLQEVEYLRGHYMRHLQYEELQLKQLWHRLFKVKKITFWNFLICRNLIKFVLSSEAGHWVQIHSNIDKQWNSISPTWSLFYTDRKMKQNKESGKKNPFFFVPIFYDFQCTPHLTGAPFCTTIKNIFIALRSRSLCLLWKI